MKNKRTLFLLSAFLGFSSGVSAELVLGRSFPSCGYVGGQIYCFGGDTNSDFTENYKIDQNIYSLDIAQFLGKEIDTMSNQWKQIIPPVNFSPENRRAPISIVLPGDKKFMIVGGYHTAYNQKFSNQTIIYDTATNTWEKGVSCTEEGRGTRQIYHSTAVNLPDNTIGFYGGLEQVPNTSVPEISASGQIMNYTAEGQSLVGFRSLKIFSPASKTWSDFSPQTNLPANYYPNTQSATIDPSSGKIYYFGGIYNTPSSNGNPTRVLFNSGYVFNTKSSSWAEEVYTGEIPTERLFHSTNLLPNSNDIILYGGSNDGTKASTDYCFTLNLSNNKWTKQDLYVPTSLSGPRYNHAALVVNSTLFVLFGRGLDGALSSSTIALNVANVSNITYTSIYNSNISEKTNNTNSTSGDHASGPDEPFEKSTPAESPTEVIDSSLSKGAIGGIAAGCVVFVLILSIFGVFYFHRQKKAKIAEQEKLNNDLEHIHEPIHVDWDKIDNEYREISGQDSSKSSNVINSADGTKTNSPELLKNTNPENTNPQNAQATTNVHINKSPDAPNSPPIKPSFRNSVTKPDVN